MVVADACPSFACANLILAPPSMSNDVYRFGVARFRGDMTPFCAIARRTSRRKLYALLITRCRVEPARPTCPEWHRRCASDSFNIDCTERYLRRVCNDESYRERSCNTRPQRRCNDSRLGETCGTRRRANLRMVET